MLKPLLTLSLAAVVLTACSSSAGTGDPSASPSDAGSGGNPASWTATAITEDNVNKAVAQLPQIIADVQTKTGIPGMAATVVYQGKSVLSAGYGVREAGTNDTVDADTAFQMASVSKPIGATAISRAISDGKVDWDDRISKYLPGFALKDPYVTKNVTIADMYSHRSGLPEHAGDLLEDLGYDRAQVLRRLRYLPLNPFRAVYNYTNFGLTAGAEAVAVATKRPWDTFMKDTLYAPLGMSDTTSSFAQYEATANKAVTHQKNAQGQWEHLANRDAQAQTPAGGVSSTANDMGKWLNFQLNNGSVDGKELIKPEVLQVMRQPQIDSKPATDPTARSGLYGYGIGTGDDGTGHVKWSHSGAFFTGAATVINMIPAADLGIAVMSNAQPGGQVEAIAASFMDIAETGSITEDWLTLYGKAFAPMLTNTSKLADKQPPAVAKPGKPLTAYAGVYENTYYGPAKVIATNGALSVVLGPKRMTFPLTSWGGNAFSYLPTGENALGISAVDFDPAKGTMTIEFLDTNGLGVFSR